MKIISKGVPKSARVWRGTCNDCRSIVEATEGELTTHSCQRDGEWAEAKCPVCKSRLLFYPTSERRAEA